MNVRIGLAAVLLAAGGGSRAALPPPADGLSAAYYRAGQDLAAGKDRRAILAGLTAAVDAHPKSGWLPYARPLAADLGWAVANPPKADAGPAGRLADSRLGPWIPRGDTGKAARDWLATAGDDPAAPLVRAGRGAIGDLLPALRDRSPTRAGFGIPITGGVGVAPRVCDVAVALIESHSHCRFHSNASTGKLFHQLPEADREGRARRVEEWWRENKDRSLTAGVRAQLPHAGFYGQVWMAKNLVRLGEGLPTDDKEFGLAFLRKLLRDTDGFLAVAVADALRELGDHSAVGLFADRWRALRDVPEAGFDSAIALHLASHGGRREWELMTEIGARTVGVSAGDAKGGVWSGLISHGKVYTCPYAIPGLGLALQRTANTGGMYVDGKTVPVSNADTAAKALQKQTGKDFGYRPGGTQEERTAAIRRAQDWWAAEGKARYTFDFIERELVGKAGRGPGK